MIATIKGKVVARQIKQPQGEQKFKPHQQIQVLQAGKNEAGLVTVKDYDLTREHKQDFSADCLVTTWVNNFNNQARLNVMVL
jgi:hypothetical protein